MTNKPVPATENELPCPHGYHWRGCPQCHRAHTVHKITPELPPLDVLPEDVEAGYDQYLDIRNEHAALHCRERQLSVANARVAELEEKSSRWKTYARGFADTLIAIETKVFGNSDPINDDDPTEWPTGLLSDKVLELKQRAELAEAQLATLRESQRKAVDWIGGLIALLPHEPISKTQLREAIGLMAPAEGVTCTEIAPSPASGDSADLG